MSPIYPIYDLYLLFGRAPNFVSLHHLYAFILSLLDISICCVYAYPKLIDAHIDGIAHFYHSGKTIA